MLISTKNFLVSVKSRRTCCRLGALLPHWHSRQHTSY
jgi:hypothetical protein